MCVWKYGIFFVDFTLIFQSFVTFWSVNVQNISPWFSLYILVNFREKEPSRKFYDVFDHFS